MWAFNLQLCSHPPYISLIYTRISQDCQRLCCHVFWFHCNCKVTVTMTLFSEPTPTYRIIEAKQSWRLIWSRLRNRQNNASLIMSSTTAYFHTSDFLDINMETAIMKHTASNLAPSDFLVLELFGKWILYFIFFCSNAFLFFWNVR